MLLIGRKMLQSPLLMLTSAITNAAAGTAAVVALVTATTQRLPPLPLLLTVRCRCHRCQAAKRLPPLLPMLLLLLFLCRRACSMLLQCTTAEVPLNCHRLLPFFLLLPLTVASAEVLPCISWCNAAAAWLFGGAFADCCCRCCCCLPLRHIIDDY